MGGRWRSCARFEMQLCLEGTPRWEVGWLSTYWNTLRCEGKHVAIHSLACTALGLRYSLSTRLLHMALPAAAAAPICTSAPLILPLPAFRPPPVNPRPFSKALPSAGALLPGV